NRSLIPTISISLPKFSTAARKTQRPMRPKPLMPTLIAIAGGLLGSSRRTWRGNPGILALPSPAFSVMTRFLKKLLPSVLITLLPASAFAWGPLGHALVGELAQRHLTPAAQAEVSTLL